MFDPPDTTAGARRQFHAGPNAPRMVHLVCIIVVAAGLRLWGLNSTSLWYDEVVTMRLARTPGPAALVARLDQIDGTRAPLHPLALQAWLRVFGPSDWAGRSFSTLCGLGTVAVIYALGRRAFDEMTGRWAAWQAAVCPPMVYYSREARMYAWLVLLSCVSWLIFLSFRRRHAVPRSAIESSEGDSLAAASGWYGTRGARDTARCVLYWLLLTSLVYSHPLGLFMVATHVIAYLLARPYLALPLRWWLMIEGAVILSIIPWLPRYIDHGTDYPMPRHSIRFLAAVPIEYVGGNGAVLGVCLAIIVFGLLKRDSALRPPCLALSYPAENLIFITWSAVPPLLMYCYSYLSQPIFGPPRYHLYIAPAYLILLAHGLSRFHAAFRWPLLAAGTALSLLLLQSYQQAMKADWRGLAAWLETQERMAGAGDPARQRVTIVVHPSDPRFPREQLEAARYYLSPRFRVIPADERDGDDGATAAEPIYEVACLARPEYGEKRGSGEHAFYGMRVKRGGATSR